MLCTNWAPELTVLRQSAYQIFKLIKILNVVPMRMHLLFFNKSCQSVQRYVKWMQVYAYHSIVIKNYITLW